MWVEHNVGTLSRRPANRFGIAPTLVADRDTEHEISGFKHSPPDAWDVDTFFTGIDLHLVLESRSRAIAVDDERCRAHAAVGDSLCAKDDGNAGVRGCGRNRRPAALEKTRIR